MGLSSKATSPFLQSFLYKTLCLSRFTYGLETLHVDQGLIDQINVSQNKLVRFFVGLKKFCRMTNVLQVLRIFNINDLLFFCKLNFVKNSTNNNITRNILISILNNDCKYPKKTLSIAHDLIKLKEKFNISSCFQNQLDTSLC